MSKSILIIDTPRQCYQCPCYSCDSVSSFCQKENRETKGNTKPDWCPLKPLPEPKYLTEEDEYDMYDSGWDDCLTNILGETDNE